MILTNQSHDLGLHAILVLEATSKVSHASFAVAGNIWHLSDLVEHVAAGEGKDGENADASPQFSALNEGQHVWGCRDERGYSSEAKNDPGGPSHPVDRAPDRGLRPAL